VEIGSSQEPGKREGGEAMVRRTSKPVPV